MTRTLHYGSKGNRHTRVTMERIDRHVIRRHTQCSYDRCMELSKLDAERIAAEVSPKLERPQYVTFKPRTVIFGRRMKFLDE